MNHLNFTPLRAGLFGGAAVAIAFVFTLEDDPLLALVCLICLFVLFFWESDEEKLKRQKTETELAVLRQKERFANGDVPIEVIPDVGRERELSRIKIDADKLSKEIDRDHEVADANNWMEISRKMAALQREMEALSGRHGTQAVSNPAPRKARRKAEETEDE